MLQGNILPTPHTVSLSIHDTVTCLHLLRKNMQYMRRSDSQIYSLLDLLYNPGERAALCQLSQMLKMTDVSDPADKLAVLCCCEPLLAQNSLASQPPTFRPSAIKPVSWKLNSLTPLSCCCVPRDSVGSKMCTSHFVLCTMSCSNSACTQTG